MFRNISTPPEPHLHRLSGGGGLTSVWLGVVSFSWFDFMPLLRLAKTTPLTALRSGFHIRLENLQACQDSGRHACPYWHTMSCMHLYWQITGWFAKPQHTAPLYRHRPPPALPVIPLSTERTFPHSVRLFRDAPAVADSSSLECPHHSSVAQSCWYDVGKERRGVSAPACTPPRAPALLLEHALHVQCALNRSEAPSIFNRKHPSQCTCA